MSQPDFTVEISHNEYLPEGGDDINAIVTVTSPTVASEDGGRAGPAADSGSAEEIRRSSATSQSVPTPRQSQLNTPSLRLIASASCSGVSCSFRPSVRRMAWRSEAG